MNDLPEGWVTFTWVVDIGGICLSHTATELGVTLDQKSRLFCGLEGGDRRAAAMSSLIVTAKVNDVDPHAWRTAAHPAHEIDELRP